MKSIIFTGPSLRAMAAGLKSESRRLTGLEEVNKRYRSNPFTFRDGVARFYSKGRRELVAEVKCPFTVGEERWVRETWMPAIDAGGGPFRYAADYDAEGRAGMSELQRWRSPIFCPRRVSRWTVRVTGAGLQPLREMSEVNARAEGVSVVAFRPDEGFPLCDGYTFEPEDETSVLYPTALKAFSAAWDTMHPKPWARWEADPRVWWFSFEARRTSARAAA